MWNQWTQYAAAPPLPTTAPPPPPQEPAGVATPVAPAIIGPMLPSATAIAPLPAAALPAVAAASGAVSAMPSALGGNPYSQYTAAQYAAMTPEQQFALQQHWQQWQKYQEEYARWHAQYGEQYKREMELAQKTPTVDTAAPPAPSTPAYASSYYQQAPPSAPSGKITGQPQLYTQPPPPQAPPQSSDTSSTKTQPPSWQPPSFNQPPPSFNQQNFNTNNFNKQQYQSSQFGGTQPQGVQGGPPSDGSQFNNRNRGANNWQGSQGNRGPDNFNNRPGNRTGPNNHGNDNWNNNEDPKINSGPDNSINNETATTTEKGNMMDAENMPVDNDEPVNSDPNNWNERQNYTGDRNQGQNHWNEGSNRNFNNNRNQNNWNDGPNNRGNNGARNWNDNEGNRGPNERSLNRGSNNRNQGSNNRGPNNWNDGPNNRGNNNWNDGPNNRGNSNWNDGPFNRGQNNWNDRGPNNRNDGPNNRGQNNWNDGPGGRNNGPNNWDDNRSGFDRNFGPNNRGPNSWNDGPNSNAPNDRGNNRDRGGQENWDCNAPNSRGAPNQRGPGGPTGPSGSSGPGNRGRITDMDEEMFDRQFRQWEQQFEDWKKANANHPDRDMYRRYEQEFEKQRKRIAERREQMRRRKLEQMGLDPNQPPPQPPQPSADSQEQMSGNENIEQPDTSGRKRNDSIGSQQSSHSKQNQELTKEIQTPVNAQEVLPEVSIQQRVVIEPTKDNKNVAKDSKNLFEENPKATEVVEITQQKKTIATPLGKRKSRFDTPVPAVKIKPIEENEVITLDDDDGDVQEVEDNQGNISEIFKKVDGIPGLDLTDDNSSKEVPPTNTEAKVDQNKFGDNQSISAANPKKIPSLFDIKVDKPDMVESNVANEQTPSAGTSTTLPDLAKTLNDPDFLKRISEAVAHAKGGDASKSQDADGRPLSFSEWQQRKQGDGTESNPNDTNADLDNTNSRESFREKSANRSQPDEDANFGNRGGGGGFPNNMGPSNFGPNNANNWGPNNNNNWGPNNNGPNIWGPNGPNNAWGPNGPNGSNNWGPNGPNNNNNFGPNGQNNWGPNGSNNWGPNVPNNNNFGPNGPNNWGPNGSNNWGPNGPNNNFGPNGPNNWGPNGPNNLGPNNFRGGNSFGPGRNFGGNGPNDAPGRNFGGNGPNDGPGRNFGGNGPNDGSGRNFGRNDGPGRNFGRNGNNFNRNNDGGGRNFGGDGSNRGPNDGPDDNFSRRRGDGNRRRRSRGGSNDRRGSSEKRSNSSNSGRDRSNNSNNTNKDAPTSEEAATPNRNINNPFRRTDVPIVDDSAAEPQSQAEGWTKGPDDNLDYGDYYRPVQVIDYSNSSNAAPTTTITPRVIDYGHKPVMTDDSRAFKPLKIINYDHASKAQNSQQQTRLTAAQKRRNRKNNKNNPQQQQQQNKQNRKQKRQQQNQAPLPQNSSAAVQNEEKALPEQNNAAADCEKREKEQDELEEISDVEDIPEEPESPPPPPPPMFNTSGTFTSFNTQNTPSSIFPSTSDANENLPKMSSSHVQMSIPTEENNNTISIDEILMKPGRQTRPKKICIILRGPPGSGKSHVARLIKEKEKEMGGNNPRILSIDDYFIIENDYEEKCPKTGKKVPKKELLYEYEKDMEEKYLEYLIKAFKKSVADNFYDFIVIDCNNNSLRSLNEFYCHSKDSGFVPYIIDLFCDLETCLERNIHERTEKDIKEIIDTWKPTPGHYIKLDISSLLQNIVEMEDAEDMVVEDNTVSDTVADDDIGSAIDENKAYDKDNDEGSIDIYNEDTNDENDEDENSTDSTSNFGLFLKSKWETDTTTENLARLDGTSKLSTKRKPTMEEYLQMGEWVPPTDTKGKKRVRWADIEEKRNQEKMRAVGFVVGQTDWKRMMDPNAAKRALNKTKYIERVNKRR